VNANKILVAAGFAVAAASAHAQITLMGAGSFSFGGVFSSLSAMPTYPAPLLASSTTSLVMNNGALSGNGSLNQWWFSVTDAAGPITSVTYSITLSGITASTVVTGLVEGQSFNPTTGAVGPGFYIISGIGTNVEAYTGSTAYRQTISFTENISASSTSTAFFKGNFQFANVVPEPTGIAALSIGALGLLIRRRRSK